MNDLRLILTFFTIHPMMYSQHFTAKQAQAIAQTLDIWWDNVRFTPMQFRNGMNAELKLGNGHALMDATDGNALLTGKIALTHLLELPDYYVRLAKKKREAKKFLPPSSHE